MALICSPNPRASARTGIERARWTYHRKQEGLLLGAMLWCWCNAGAVQGRAPAPSSVTRREPEHGAGGGWEGRHLPATFGSPVAVGDKMYVNFSRGDGHERLVEVTFVHADCRRLLAYQP